MGKNNLRNYDSMRKFLVKYFFDYDKDTPLDTFKKFMKDELPELNVSLLKDSMKRKSESRAGLQAKNLKSDSTTITENQKNLKNCRQNFLDCTSKKQGLGEHLVSNPIIKKVTNFKEIMSNWNRGDPCQIFRESWFDQKNATTGKNIGTCLRCRNLKEKEIPMFSHLDKMIPDAKPDCLKDLNEIKKGAIRLIIPYVTMIKNKAGGRGYSGHNIRFYQDIASFAQTLPESLPRPIEDLQIILVKTLKTKGD